MFPDIQFSDNISVDTGRHYVRILHIHASCHQSFPCYILCLSKISSEFYVG